MSGRACSSLKPASSSAHSISTGPPTTASALRIRRPSVTACAASRHGSPHELARHRLRHGAGAMAAGLAVILAAGVDRAQEALAARARCGRAPPRPARWPSRAPGRADQHLALGGLAQAAAGGARGDQRLDQHRHGGVGGREAVVLHVAARIGGPQRGPAGAHGGEERRPRRRCPRKLSNWPAKLAPSRSSISAEERTALGLSRFAAAPATRRAAASRISGAIGCSIEARAGSRPTDAAARRG